MAAPATHLMKELELASAAALAAGRILQDEFARGTVINSAGGKDIKTQADVLAEAEILTRLRAATDWPILSEEAGADPNFSTLGRYWVIDPLDGTFNFTRRIPLCCVSIGLWENGEPLLGVIHDFLAGRTYQGVVGVGAWDNGQPMNVSAEQSKAASALATGFPSGRSYQNESLLGFVQQVQAYKKLRLLGSAALSLAWVAAGKVEAYHEEDIYFWDVAAGLALVKAAGGTYQAKPGNGAWKWNVLAANRP